MWDCTGRWKVTDVDHEIGNIGVVVWPPLQSEFEIEALTSGYVLHTGCWMNWGRPGDKPIQLTVAKHDKNGVDFTGTAVIDGVDHPLTLTGTAGGGGRARDRFKFKIYGNPRGTGGAGRG